MNQFPSDILEKIRVHLEDEKKQVTNQIADLNSQDPFSNPERLNDNAANDAEANEESSHDRFTALVEELNTKLANIDNALKRIGEGTYGFCSNCGAMIDTDRLSILPTATLCLACESAKS